MPPPPERRLALVTGSTSGIGAAIARRLARDGHFVVAHGRRARDAVGSVLADIGAADYMAADLSDEGEARGLIAGLLKRHRRLHVLVNNAGETVRIPHTDLKAATPAIWRRMMEVNVIAPWVLVAEAEAALRRSAEEAGRPACIVNIGTHAAVRPKGGSIPYAASKAALHHTTKLLALTLGPAIRVNGVAPGLVDTPMSTGWDAAYELWNTKSPMRRVAQPDDIADLVAALVANDYITGEIILADGGLNLT
jgi:NAD(P)-dependent dehydrogenase (short-subunit alcohol dehydrogenase family)